MSYTPTTWATGDVITAEKLNNMESGIENAGVMIATITEDSGSYTCDKTYEEIKEVIDNRGLVVVKDSELSTYLPLSGIMMMPNGPMYIFKNSVCTFDTANRDKAIFDDHTCMIGETFLTYQTNSFSVTAQEENQ